VLDARDKAEAGARKALEQLAVHQPDAWPTMAAEQKTLRNRLRARGRQLGDRDGERRGTRTIDKLVAECAYEHWHRMLFARFLAECQVLVEPTSGVPVSLGECKELAREQGTDWLPLACSFAQRMLPQIFRSDDPVLEVLFPIEYRQALEQLLASLPPEVFLADDSLGWVYQFWQSKRKDEINASGVKIGADELPAVTQLFTEDYMVLFLLENTLGAWWAGKHLQQHPELARSAADEEELRRACAPPGYQWTYLRFVKAEDGRWNPAAGCFDGWPREARDIRVLDPCMGSGHFLVFALPILTALRMTEEGLGETDAITVVLRDNLFGLEIDPRCTQIAAFNLALAAWRRAGFCAVPRLNIACVGLALTSTERDWTALAGDNERCRKGMELLYRLFGSASTLGSLVNPRSLGGDILQAGFPELHGLLERALQSEAADETKHELTVAAQGIARAAEILADRFFLVVTNVPYLGRDRQHDSLKDYCLRTHPLAKADLATCLLERCIAFAAPAGTAAIVAPQSWLYQDTFRELRPALLQHTCVDFLARLGTRAFEAISGEIVNVCLVSVRNAPPSPRQVMAGVDVCAADSVTAKQSGLESGQVCLVDQADLLKNPDAKIGLEAIGGRSLLTKYATSHLGVCTGDYSRFGRAFWEVAVLGRDWAPQHSTVTEARPYGGMSNVLFWQEGEGAFTAFLKERLGNDGIYQWLRGKEAWGKRGVVVSATGKLAASLYLGDLFDNNVTVILPRDEGHLPAIWAFCESTLFRDSVRRINQALKITDQSMVQVPFELDQWQEVAAREYPAGLPAFRCQDATQWLFEGHPKDAERPLQVAVSRLLSYRWPRQTGSSFMDCPALCQDGLESHTDDDGIVCINALHGEATAADRLTRLLADAFGDDWSSTKLNGLLEGVGAGGRSLEAWLREGFFEQHCALFHQRPFVWHIWDGLRDGFAALVNYHRLAGPNGQARRTLEKLIYTYLGDWLDRQRADQAADVQGADARVAAAQHLKRELERILEGEPPYDIFVRWKSVQQQPLGWEPDLNDGVRLNIRPFMTARPLGARGLNACILRATPKVKWEKDRGKEPTRPAEDFPWFWGWDEKAGDFAGARTFDGNRWNDLHYTRDFKLAARERAQAKGGRK
jgi:hypothetical protein